MRQNLLDKASKQADALIINVQSVSVRTRGSLIVIILMCGRCFVGVNEKVDPTRSALDILCLCRA